MKIMLMNLEALRKEIRVRGELRPHLEQLFQIGMENLAESGVDLVRNMMFLRGLTVTEIEEYCEIRAGNLQKALDNGKIGKDLQRKLNKLIK